MAETKTPTEENMKKLLLILMALMLWVCPVWADEIEGAPLQIQNNIRLMIHAGISEDDATLLTRSMLQHRFRERHVIQVQNMLMETGRPARRSGHEQSV